MEKLPITVSISSANVYYNKVQGYASPGSTVKLYKNGVYTEFSDTADSEGFYSIAYDFGYYNGYYDGYRIYPDSVGHKSLYGYTTPNTYVVAYDGNGSYLGSDRSYSSGYYNISYSYVSNTSAIRVYNGYYDGYYHNGYYYGYYDLSDYYLIAEKGDVSSSKLYLNNAYINDYYPNWNNGYWNGYYDYAKYASISDAKAGNSYVKGYGVNSYASITIKDSLGYTLGTTSVDNSRYFTLYTNRTLRYGETLTIITSISNYKDASTTYTVGGSSTNTTVDKYNYSNTFYIGSGKLSSTVNGISNTKYMDVAPYIKDGRTMLPLRYVAESLGYSVSWNNITRIATFMNGSKIILVSIDSSKFYIDGLAYNFSVKPEIKDGRTMLPISDIGKALGLSTDNKGDGKNIEWDSSSKSVLIQYYK